MVRGKVKTVGKLVATAPLKKAGVPVGTARGVHSRSAYANMKAFEAAAKARSKRK